MGPVKKKKRLITTALAGNPLPILGHCYMWLCCLQDTSAPRARNPDAKSTLPSDKYSQNSGVTLGLSALHHLGQAASLELAWLKSERSQIAKQDWRCTEYLDYLLLCHANVSCRCKLHYIAATQPDSIQALARIPGPANWSLKYY